MNAGRAALVAGALAGVVLAGAAPPALPLWAYGYIDYPSAPGDYRSVCQGERSDPCERPNGLPTDPGNTPRRLAGSDRVFTVAEINARFSPADWFPNDHPPMPQIVAHGREANGMRACAICHLPNGKGMMQNGSVAGLPRDYILQQLADFKSGKRHTADPNKANGYEMQAIARNLSEAEAQAAADYFASLRYTKWVRVVEATQVPVFTATVNGLYLREEGARTVPLGQRIVELPEDTYQSNILRNPRSGFVAYVPIGSVRRGEALVTARCTACHGADLRGLNLQGVIMPPIAGRPPGQMARALYDYQQGARNGVNAQLMRPFAMGLGAPELIAISAYLASLDP